ncbi:hypothetical protein GGQ68_004328 [Sagittula marina]|uniref:CBU-0592-like domain-containing protein n=1 Tax=Sagittula marina TaxID=943940 RepID=A0A7W6DZ47_9RHOB|nr:hypothetical protein [Sagittula marina]MBB3987974.1 hypothetical protein [Sagittula marina]
MLDALQTTDVYTAIRLIGALIYVSNYTLLSLGWHSSDAQRYYLLNVLAAGAVMASLMGQFNLPALMIQFFYCP